MTPVGFEPTQLALVELESTPLDHSGKVSMSADARAAEKKPGGQRALHALQPEVAPSKRTTSPQPHVGPLTNKSMNSDTCETMEQSNALALHA